MDSAALRRKLTVELMRLRQHAGLTQRQVADSLDWSPSKIIRTEQGAIGIAVTDLRALLDLYRVTDSSIIGQLESMARGSKRQPFAEYRDVLPVEAVRYLSFEASAATIRQLALNVVPELLQTEDYSRSLLDVSRTPSAQIDRLVESRRERQELFERADPPETQFIVDESVLLRQVGGISVMHHQIDHLLTMAARPTVRLQILPFDAGAHSGLDGSFTYLEFSDLNDRNVVFVQGKLGDILVRDDDDPIVAAVAEQFWALEEIATPGGDFPRIVRRRRRLEAAARDLDQADQTARARVWQPLKSALRTSAQEQIFLESVSAHVAADAVDRDHDVFVSHASTDLALARELAGQLTSLGADVWIDDLSIGFGKNWVRAIDRGIASAHVGVVLVTPAVIAGRPWVENEFSALLSSKETVIPILHEVTFEQLASYSPLLHLNRGLTTSERSIAEIALLIVSTLVREAA